MGRTCSTHREKRNTCRILEGKSERKRPLGRPRHVWVGSNKVHLRDRLD
jgi:hypothetical protein